MTKQTSAKVEFVSDGSSLNAIGAGRAGARRHKTPARRQAPSDAQIQSLVDLCRDNQLVPALAAGTRLLSEFPKSALLYKILGDINVLLGQSDAAVICYSSAISITPGDADTYNALGKLLCHQQDKQRAATCFDRAIAINPASVVGYVNMGDMLFEHRDFIGAADYYMAALTKEPDHEAACYNLAQSLRALSFEGYMPQAAEMFVKILDKTPLVRPEDLAPAALSLVRLEPGVVAAMARVDAGDLAENLEETVSGLAEATLLSTLMRLCPLPDLKLEKALTRIRAAFLEQASTLRGSPALTKFCEALAIQCFINEFVYDQTDLEKSHLSRLEACIADKLQRGVQPDPVEICVVASYKRLSDCEWVDLVTPMRGLEALFETQVVEQRQQAQLRKEIPALKQISNDVSVDVRAQYEEHPYPRWRNCGVFFKPFLLADLPRILSLRIKNAKALSRPAPEILIAGSGTGRTAIESAINYKGSRVLAVDLSLTSLSYAKHRARALAVENIDFLQADLLDLGALDRQFDLIESTGVLHHMAHPMAGWRVLVDCLKPGGLMKIGLYSELARRHIVAIRQDMRKAIAAQDIGALIQLRSRMLHADEVPHAAVARTSDFFSMSTFRDLVFHVQEHRFTLPQINECLADLDLEFCGFEGGDILRAFKTAFSEDDDLLDLEKWQIFETNYPDSFAAMYQFWCQKRS